MGRATSRPAPLDAAQQAVDRGTRVYTIGFGTANPGDQPPRCPSRLIGGEPFGVGGFGSGGFGGVGGPGGFRRGIDEETLRAVAEMTGGEYYPAESAGDLHAVFDGLPTHLITRHEAIEMTVGFVAAGYVLLGVAVLLGQLWRPLPIGDGPAHGARGVDGTARGQSSSARKM